MARNNSGILGNFRGKIGTVVGCQLGDTFYIRSLPRRRTSPLSERELANISAFKLVQNWLSPIKDVLQTGFRNYGSRSGGMRAAIGYTRMHALAGTYPNLYINPAKVMVSGGSLPQATDAAVAYNGSGWLQFTWAYDPHDEANPADQVMLLAYDTANREAVYNTAGAFRRDGDDTLAIPGNWSGRQVEVWMAFLAADRSRQSESRYMGSVLCG